MMAERAIPEIQYADPFEIHRDLRYAEALRSERDALRQENETLRQTLAALRQWQKDACDELTQIREDYGPRRRWGDLLLRADEEAS